MCSICSVKAALKRYIKKHGIEHTKPLKLENKNACRNCGEQTNKKQKQEQIQIDHGCIINKVCIPNIPNILPIVNNKISVIWRLRRCECEYQHQRKNLFIAHEKVCPFNNAYVREYFLNGGKMIP
jgi:hypothetical protein